MHTIIVIRVIYRQTVVKIVFGTVLINGQFKVVEEAIWKNFYYHHYELMCFEKFQTVSLLDLGLFTAVLKSSFNNELSD